jgi:outer membrane receptor protein involved in Fe transport
MASKLFPRSFFLLFFLFPLFISAQQAFVSGTVRDSATGDALIGVVVQSSSGSGAVTDLSGSYMLKVAPGEQTITFRYTGYLAQSHTVNADQDKTVRLEIMLVSNSKQMNLVVISSGRYEQNIGEVPVSMEVLRPRLIENKNTTTMETAIDQVPGVTMTDGQANIRGGSGFSYGAGSRVLLVVDDMPMLSGDAADVKWNYLPVENVSQVEVMKGASSALFGASALNGVIHFRTAYPGLKPQTSITLFNGFYDEPKRRELKWWGSSNPTYSGVNFSHSRQIGNLDLVVGGHVFNDEGYRYLETEQRARLNVNTRYRFKKVPGLNAGVNTNMMRTSGGLFILWYNDSLAYIPADSTLQNYKNYRFNIDPYISYYGAKGHRHRLNTRYFRTDNRNNLLQGSLAEFWYAEYQYQYKFKNAITITSGAVASYTDVHSDLYQDHNASNVSGYVQVDKKFFDRLFVTFGVRGEYYRVDTATTEFKMNFSKNDTLTLPFRPVVRIGANYQLSEAAFIRASYGQGYRFPSIAEKFVRTDAAGLQIYPNASLQPESGQSAEIGIKQGVRISGWKGFADVSVFWMEYSNMMEFVFGQWGRPFIDPLFGVGFKSVNIGRTRTRGIDFSIMGQGKLGDFDISLLAGYTWMDPVSLTFNPAQDTLKNTSTENILKYRYRHIAKFDGEIGYRKFTFGFSMRYNSFMENIDKFFEQALPGIKAYRERFHTGDIVFDARFMYQLTENARISLIGNNIFNREYTSRPADVQPPRNFALQVMLKF